MERPVNLQSGKTKTIALIIPSLINPFFSRIAGIINTELQNLGCMTALKENNVKLPEDISLVTFDDHPYLDYLSTPLTCVAQPTEDICKIAIKLLFSLINQQAIKANQIFLQPTLRYRDSVKQL